MSAPKESRLPPNQQLIKSSRWPIVGEDSPRPSDEPWGLRIGGLVGRSMSWTLEELQSLPSTELVTDVHCVTRWSKYDMRFQGVPLAHLLELAAPSPDAKFISFVARSERQHSTSLPLEEAIRLGGFVAWGFESDALPIEHGGPLRMVMPGKYFYKSVKWLERIELLDNDRLGFWESDAGYHNGADPWLEQRYLASSLSRREAGEIMRFKNIASRDLLGLQAADLDLSELQATHALLRNANFSRSNLQRADFGHANLSNSQFLSSDLRNASFAKADLEGADLSGANLCGADLSGASLFGASFSCQSTVDESSPRHAIFDESTRFDLRKLDSLTDDQRSFVFSAAPWLRK